MCILRLLDCLLHCSVSSLRTWTCLAASMSQCLAENARPRRRKIWGLPPPRKQQGPLTGGLSDGVEVGGQVGGGQQRPPLKNLLNPMPSHPPAPALAPWLSVVSLLLPPQALVPLGESWGQPLNLQESTWTRRPAQERSCWEACLLSCPLLHTPQALPSQSCLAPPLVSTPLGPCQLKSSHSPCPAFGFWGGKALV